MLLHSDVVNVQGIFADHYQKKKKGIFAALLQKQALCSPYAKKLSSPCALSHLPKNCRPHMLHPICFSVTFFPYYNLFNCFSNH